MELSLHCNVQVKMISNIYNYRIEDRGILHNMCKYNLLLAYKVPVLVGNIQLPSFVKFLKGLKYILDSCKAAVFPCGLTMSLFTMHAYQ